MMMMYTTRWCLLAWVSGATVAQAAGPAGDADDRRCRHAIRQAFTYLGTGHRAEAGSTLAAASRAECRGTARVALAQARLALADADLVGAAYAYDTAVRLGAPADEPWAEEVARTFREAMGRVVVRGAATSTAGLSLTSVVPNFEPAVREVLGALHERVGDTLLLRGGDVLYFPVGVYRVADQVVEVQAQQRVEVYLAGADAAPRLPPWAVDDPPGGSRPLEDSVEEGAESHTLRNFLIGAALVGAAAVGISAGVVAASDRDVVLDFGGGRR